MKINKSLTLGAGLTGLLGFASAANASYVTYDFTSGSITVTALLNGSVVLSGGVIALSGGDVVFDPTAGTMQLQSFSFSGATTAPLNLTGLFAGDTLSLSSLNLNPGIGYNVTGFSGTNPYTFSATSLAGSAAYVLTTPGGVKSGTASETGSDNTTIASTITLGPGDTWQTLNLSQVVLGEVNLGTKANPQMFIIKGDITFNAAPVPVPAALWLFASGLGLLPFARRKRAA